MVAAEPIATVVVGCVLMMIVRQCSVPSQLILKTLTQLNVRGCVQRAAALVVCLDFGPGSTSKQTLFENESTSNLTPLELERLQGASTPKMSPVQC